MHVLIINWNGLEHLPACFDSLVESAYANAKFILLDNDSDDGSVEFVKETYPDESRVEILKLDSNLGWSGANNVGMQAALDANADYVLLLNNDTRVEPDFLEHLVEMAESDKNIAALSPRILMYDEPQIINSLGLEASVIGAGWDTAIGRVDNPCWDTQKPILGVCGAAMFLRVKALRKTGLLPENFGIYLDDLDLCLRIWKAGYNIHLCYASVVFHKFSATMGGAKQSHKKYYLNTRNRTRIAIRHFPISRWPYIDLKFFIGECKALGRGALNGDYWKFPVHLRTWLDALLYLPIGLKFRITQKRSRKGENDIWSMITKDKLFFPGVQFPKNGFYPETTLDDENWRPMARCASFQHEGGGLSLRLHPSSPGPITLTDTDGATYTISPEDSAAKHFDFVRGEISIETHALTKVETQHRVRDIGAWLAINTKKDADEE
ncbi:MAG: glycosyltransferase family 2 protein [Candidatus Hydrogenedentota bacterium]